MYILWIIVLVAGIILEAATFTLISMWFAIGAVAAIIAAGAGAGTAVQVVVFFAVSFISLAATRPLLKKIMPKKYVPTNGELDIGKTAQVIETICAEKSTGRVRLEGIDWGAVSEDGSVIEEGTTVVVVSKGGAYLTVKKQAISIKK